MSSHISDEIRELVVNLHNEGQPPKQIPGVLGCSRYQVYRVVKAYDADGQLSRKKTGVKKERLTKEHKDFVIDQIDGDCSITLKSLKTKLFERFELNICPIRLRRLSAISASVSKEYTSFQSRSIPENI
ncbi:hypothetical protein RF11_04199 [Thelohanellus kitauei]|uniref:Paired domain-containing protein n=1 Tax=Thelohanellus kitauei TaxID=669202 RepID=A0A0C2JZN0_THEKT|nr:hypothetical protein RF11_04199 [Thelohanellus kitauei]